MSKHSARAQWNTANARLANKPFDNLFDPLPSEIAAQQAVEHPNAGDAVCRCDRTYSMVYSDIHKKPVCGHCRKPRA